MKDMKVDNVNMSERYIREVKFRYRPNTKLYKKLSSHIPELSAMPSR